MKKSLLLFGLLICSGAYAQKFNDKFLFERFDTFSQSKEKYQPIGCDTVLLEKKQLEVVLNNLGLQLQAALNNLEDTTLGLKPFYDSIWGAGFTKKLITEMTELRRSLKDSTYKSSHSLFLYVPDPAQLRKSLSGKSLVNVESGKGHPGEQQFNLIAIDAYKQWLIDYYKASHDKDGLKELEMNMSYINKWRQLEKGYDTAKLYAEELKALYGRVMNCSETGNTLVAKLDSITRFEQRMPEASRLEIHTLLKTTPFYKNWLWYTHGKLSMNPLVVTNPWRLYPATEPNSLISEPDAALFKSMDVDTALRRFLTTRKIVNKVWLPLTEDDQWELYHYDASYKYVTSKKNNKTRLTDKARIALLVHNLPAEVKVSVSVSDAELKDMSPAARQLDEAFNIFSGALTELGGKTDAVTELTTALNFNRLISLVRNANIASSGGTINTGDLSFSQFHSKSTEEKNDIQKFLEENTEADFVTVNRFKVVLVKSQDTDKRGIIRALTADFGDEKCKGLCSTLPEHVLDSFITRDNCFMLDYKNGQIEASVKKLQARFECFLQAMEDCNARIKALSLRLNSKLKQYQRYVQITNRSLPPAEVNAETDEQELYRTEIIYPELPEAPKTRTYVLSETKKTKDGETTQNVAAQKISFAPVHYLDVSAGIAFTTSAYTIGKKGANDLPERVPGEQFKVIAGIHFYPCGIFKIENKIPGKFKNRSSIFLGISIPQSLDNYYLGYSYDWVPGIRTIGGLHFYRETRFKVFNNQISEQASGLSLAGFFLSVNIQPSTFVKALGLF